MSGSLKLANSHQNSIRLAQDTKAQTARKKQPIRLSVAGQRKRYLERRKPTSGTQVGIFTFQP